MYPEDFEEDGILNDEGPKICQPNIHKTPVTPWECAELKETLITLLWNLESVTIPALQESESYIDDIMLVNKIVEQLKQKLTETERLAETSKRIAKITFGPQVLSLK